MPLIFEMPYKLEVASNNYVAPTIVLGSRKAVRQDDEGETGDVIEFLTTGDNPHMIFGEPADRENGIVEIADEKRIGDDGKSILWRFIPLTLAVWRELGESGAISGYEKLKWQIKDEGTLANYYIGNFLLDYWRPDWKAPPL